MSVAAGSISRLGASGRFSGGSGLFRLDRTFSSLWGGFSPDAKLKTA
jgi:hypothetical protein